MSTQGTGSIASHSLERTLLASWGDWARNGGAGGGYMGLFWLRKSTGTQLFGDDLMVAVDRAVATLPIAHKKVLKKMFLSRMGIRIPQSRKDAAVGAFADTWNESDYMVFEA